MPNVSISSFTVPANTVGVGLTGYSLTGSNAQSMFDLSGTWNTTGTPTALKLNVTDTASAAGSLLLDLQLGGNGRCNVRKDGRVRLPNSIGYSAISHIGPVDGQGLMFWGNSVTTVGGSALGFTFNGTDNFVAYNQSIGWTVASIGGQPDAWGCKFWQEVASTAVGMRDRTNAQTFRVYGTYTDASNFTRLALGHNGTSAFISEQIAGTGVAGGIAVSAASLSGSQATSLLDMTQTWNTSGTPTALKLNVTDTASNAASLLMDLQVGGVSRLSVSKLGGVTSLGGFYVGSFAANSTGKRISVGGTFCVSETGTQGPIIYSAGYLGWTSGAASINSPTADLTLFRDAANTLAQRNGVNAQTKRIYGTYTDASNYTRLALGHNGTRAFIAEEIAGTGVAGGIGVSAASLSGSQATSLLDMSQTWNTTGTPTALKLNVTDTASNASSLLMDLQVGGASRFGVYKNGNFDAGISRQALFASYQTGSFSTTEWVIGLDLPSATTGVLGLSLGGLGLNQSASLAWTNGSNPNGNSGTVKDLFLRRDAANTLAQRNGVNAQTFNIYNTFTDASNYERGKIAWSSNVLQIGTEKAGTGTARAVDLQTDGTTRVTLGASGGITLADANDVAVGSTTGTKIGTATTQKLGFWNAAPIVQPTTAVAAATVAATGAGDVVAASTTFDGYTIPQIVKALRNAGLLA